MTDYILSIDQGTTSSRAIIFNRQGQALWQAQQEFEQLFPADGWVEHRAADIWQSVLSVCREVFEQSQLSAVDINSIGITNQRETTLVWDKVTGEPVYNAIVWQDRRTAEYCEQLKQEGFEETVSAKTGLLLDPYFSASKLAWILDNVDGVRARAEAGELLFGTVDSYLLWQLSEGRSHRTDASNASRTLLFNIHEQCWDEALLTRFNIPRVLLPEVCDSSAHYGDTRLFGAPIAITGVAGDQQAALIGQACFAPGMAKSTYGTGCFLMLNTGEQALRSRNRLLTTVAYRLNGKVCYAAEGSIFIAGAAIQWLRDGLKLLDNAAQSETLARTANPNSQVYFVPAFTGLGAPYWDPHARGAISGITRDTGIAEMVAAALHAVCYQTRDLLEAMSADGASPANTLRIDGGMSSNEWLVQKLADLTGMTVDRPASIETTALGAAYLAGLHTGLFKSLEEIGELWHCHDSKQPKVDPQQSHEQYRGWLDAVERVRTV